jgi:thymidylate synthase ThyX
MEIPYWVSVHFVRHHIGVNHYVQTQRDDRQKDLEISRNDKPQGEIVSHIMSINAQELIQMSHKRLCAQASKETRQVMKQIVELVIEKYPEFKEVLVPLCVYRNNKCTEMFPCPKVNKFKQQEQHIKDTAYLFDIYESVIDELPFTITDLFQSKEDLEVYDRFYGNKPKEFENEY